MNILTTHQASVFFPSIVDDGKHLEMGAQWLHGYKGNPVYQLVKNKKMVEWKGDNNECGELSNSE